jgi:hypothetical protein
MGNGSMNDEEEYDWENDILWGAEYERGKEYFVKITYFDGSSLLTTGTYLQPVKGNMPVNGVEYLMIPQFAVSDPAAKVGFAKTLEVMSG